jgi:hypothetical protein
MIQPIELLIDLNMGGGIPPLQPTPGIVVRLPADVFGASPGAILSAADAFGTISYVVRLPVDIFGGPCMVVRIP